MEMHLTSATTFGKELNESKARFHLLTAPGQTISNQSPRQSAATTGTLFLLLMYANKISNSELVTEVLLCPCTHVTTNV